MHGLAEPFMGHLCTCHPTCPHKVTYINRVSKTSTPMFVCLCVYMCVCMHVYVRVYARMCLVFIHLFIPDNSIAPHQVQYYSEVYVCKPLCMYVCMYVCM